MLLIVYLIYLILSMIIYLYSNVRMIGIHMNSIIPYGIHEESMWKGGGIYFMVPYGIQME